jgi:hypothetical protein
VQIRKKAKIIELLTLQASQSFKMLEKMLPRLSFAFPVEVQGCLVHRKGT